MPKMEGPIRKGTKRRGYATFLFCLFIYGFLVYRLIDIQILKSEDYSQRVENQSTDKISLNSGRGTIYDRNNKPLTDVEKKQIIAVSKDNLNNDSETLSLIKKATNMSELEIYKIFQEQVDSTIIEIEVSYLDEKIKKELEENDIIVEEKSIRYSEDRLLAHTIGYIKKSDNSGQSGIEKSMDDVLKNSNEKYISVFRAGQAGNTGELDILKGSVKVIDSKDKEQNIKLTIDSDIQKIVEKVADKEENPSAIVISDVDTGEILAMSSRPSFDQNKPYIENGNKDEGQFINRVTQSTYPPASVFKLVVLYAALGDNAVDENYIYNCTGQTKIGNADEILKCHKLDGHGIENLQQALSNSCNTAFLDIAMKVGNDKIFKAAEELHLTDKIDIGIEEASSNIPEKISIRNLAIGQGSLEFTPLQVNQMTQVIANNGTYKPLYMYDSIIANNKNIIKVFKNSKDEEMISPYNITIIKEMMKNVSKDGTAKELQELKLGCGVKTGTAQSSANNKKINHGWITGFYPENNPKYAITILIQGTEDSSKSAIPMFKDICQKLN